MQLVPCRPLLYEPHGILIQVLGGCYFYFLRPASEGTSRKFFDGASPGSSVRQVTAGGRGLVCDYLFLIIRTIYLVIQVALSYNLVKVTNEISKGISDV